MEVGEEKTSNHLEESTATVSNERVLENDCINDNELAKEVLESNPQEVKGEESAVIVPKLDDPKPSVTMAVGETAVEKELIVQGGISESDGCCDSVAVESTCVLKDEKYGDEGATADEIPTAGVLDEEHGGCDLTTSAKVDGGESEVVVIVRDNTNTNGSSVVENDKHGGETDRETVKMEENVSSLPAAEIGEREEVIIDFKSDDGVDTVKENSEIVQGDEAITEGQDDIKGVNAEEMVADEEEGKMADEDKPLGVAEIEEEESMMANEEKPVDTDMESDEDAAMADEEKEGTDSPEQPIKTRGRPGRKRKRGGKTPNATPKTSGGGGKTIEEEDVCFICFDGGDLVLCDKRDCPKAYHPSCINREEAFFQTKGKWNCGWHLCSICQKKAEYRCYTCTFSLCKTCIKKNVILCVREKEKKGFCETCMKTIMLIEKNSQENQGNVDFDDRNSWEYLFKDYWTDMKEKLNLSLSELIEAKNAWKGSELAGKQEPPAGPSDHDSGSENPSEKQESQTKKTRRRKSKKLKTRDSAAITSAGPGNTKWASKELLEFVTHMGNDTSYKSQFDVQALLLEYIKTNRLRDSKRKSQIICDARLQGLFGKPRVGHFEMLKLLESHFLIKEDDDNQGSVVDTEVSPIIEDKTKDKKRKISKKGDREPQSNREDYAAIDIHNINLIYLRRKLAEDLLDDIESFHSKIVGTFVRIRISGANHHDIYRLVQVTGTTKGTLYMVGKKMTDIMLEILNLDKTESISIDTISNQDFTEDECKRLRQSIKCGLINRLTVGDILDKAIELQAARVNDWLETEVVRLSHLRDRASDLGRKKELRECVEKLQVLKTPEERARRLQDIPVIHDDPTMDPKYESEDETNEDDKKQDMYNKSSVDSRFSKRREHPSKESWKGTGTSRNPVKSYEFSRSLSSNNFSKKVEDAASSPCTGSHNENIRDQGRERIVQSPTVLKKPSSATETEKKDVSETEKIWHYKDPSGKIQGPFSMAQLRKWNNNKFFPVDLRIWKMSEKEDDGILLTDALEGRFTVRIERHGFANLPSPTPNQSLGPSVGPSLQSPTPNSSHLATLSVAGANKEPNAMVQPVTGQNAYGWSGGPQPNQWVVQNSAGNFLQQPPQPNVSWPTVPPNPNMGLVGPTSGNQTMNWGTSNVNPSWGPGWVPPQSAQGVTPNQGWVAGPVSTQGPIVSGNGNPGDVASAGNQGSSWVGGPGNLNQGWGSPRPRNQPYNNRGGGSGFNGNKWQWDKGGSFNNRGRWRDSDH